MNHTTFTHEPSAYFAGKSEHHETRSEKESLLRRRFAATAIDLLLMCTGAWLLGEVRWTFGAFAVGLFLMRDWGEGYSPGKRLFNLVACDSPAHYCTLAASVLRNITLMPPMLFVELPVMLFSRRGLRLGDILGSSVVQFRDLPTAPRTEDTSEIVELAIEAPAEHPQAGESPAKTMVGDTDSCDPMIIDPGLLAPDTLPPEQVAGNTQADDSAEEPEAGDPHRARTQACTLAIPPELAARCLAIEGRVSPENLDDAYWTYVERYSPDAAQRLSDDELPARCRELAASKADLPVTVPVRPAGNADRAACLTYLNDWFVIINKCRDTLS